MGNSSNVQQITPMGNHKNRTFQKKTENGDEMGWVRSYYYHYYRYYSGMNIYLQANVSLTRYQGFEP